VRRVVKAFFSCKKGKFKKKVKKKGQKKQKKSIKKEENFFFGKKASSCALKAQFGRIFPMQRHLHLYIARSPYRIENRILQRNEREGNKKQKKKKEKKKQRPQHKNKSLPISPRLPLNTRLRTSN
jgi:hypothetical protein